LSQAERTAIDWDLVVESANRKKWADSPTIEFMPVAKYRK
jgi:hypothetical protein